MECLQSNNQRRLADFIRENDGVNYDRNSRLIGKCRETRDLASTIGRGYIDLMKLEETEFLLETAKNRYSLLLVEWDRLQMVSHEELENLLENLELIAEIRRKEIQAK